MQGALDAAVFPSHMKLFPWSWAAVVVLGMCAVQTPANAENAARTSACGPPRYCARTDRKVEKYPEKPPAIPAAGSIITDPTFGSRILRVTDEKSDPIQLGRPVYTPSSAEQNAWNTNSTEFYVTTSGGSFLIYQFDPATMTARQAKPPKLPWGPEPHFSFRQPDILYGMQGRKPGFEQYDTSSGRVTEVDDPAKCVKLAPGDRGSDISVSGDDNRFTAVLGPQQDRFFIIYVYDRTRGCRWYNTQTGEIGGRWGPTGTVSIPDRFTMHNARMSKSGKFVYTVRPRGKWVVWEIDTLNASVCETGCSAHHALGYSHIVGTSNLRHPLDLWIRPLNHISSTTPLISGLEPAKGFWYDSHLSWNNADPDDTTPVCFSTYRPTNPEGAAPLVTGPWENEIDCAETDGKGSKVWRFAHTYSTAKNGFWSSPRGNVSQDGRFFMFTSDWQDQLGKIPNGQRYRTDVFIVELR
jgi:hypothetical protein